MKKLLPISVLIFLLGILYYLYFSAPNFIIMSREKCLPFTDYNVKKIEWNKEVTNIKKAFNIVGIAKIDNFRITFNPNGIVKEFTLRLVVLKSNLYYIYNAVYDTNSKDYKVYCNKCKDFLQYNRLRDENLFCSYMNQVDYGKFRPKISSQYDSYTIEYYNAISRFEKNPNYDIYILCNAKIDKFVEDNKFVEGFALFVYGNKIVNYKDHKSEESQSSNVYIFLE